MLFSTFSFKCRAAHFKTTAWSWWCVPAFNNLVPAFLWVYRRNKHTWDVAWTRKKLANHELEASDLRAFLLFSKHPNWVYYALKPIENAVCCFDKTVVSWSVEFHEKSRIFLQWTRFFFFYIHHATRDSLRIFNNYSLQLVNSQCRRRLNGLLTQRPWRREE